MSRRVKSSNIGPIMMRKLIGVNNPASQTAQPSRPDHVFLKFSYKQKRSLKGVTPCYRTVKK
jgi:hypothetical protein